MTNCSIWMEPYSPRHKVRVQLLPSRKAVKNNLHEQDLQVKKCPDWGTTRRGHLTGVVQLLHGQLAFRTRRFTICAVCWQHLCVQLCVRLHHQLRSPSTRLQELLVSPEKSMVTLFTPDTHHFNILPEVYVCRRHSSQTRSGTKTPFTFDTMYTLSKLIKKSITKANTCVVIRQLLYERYINIYNVHWNKIEWMNLTQR